MIMLCYLMLAVLMTLKIQTLTQRLLSKYANDYCGFLSENITKCILGLMYSVFAVAGLIHKADTFPSSDFNWLAFFITNLS